MPGIVISGKMLESFGEHDEDNVRLDIVERKLAKMEPDDPEMPALLKEARTLRRDRRIRQLSKELEDMKNGEDHGGFY
jgi:hypothetical protein|tara:strand:+ start:110 stop:343 length:234 start_codon:yes stop_codon:yes gene_type:complete